MDEGVQQNVADMIRMRADHPLRARFFAVPASAPRDRRPTDVIVLVASCVVLALFATRAGSPPQGFEAVLTTLMSSFPSVLDPLWRIAFDTLALWGVFVVGIAFVRRHWSLVRDIALTAALVILVAAVVGYVVYDEWPDIIAGLFGADPDLAYPAVGLALWIGITSLVSSHVSRPYRYLGRWISITGALAAIALGVTTTSGAMGAAALGFAAAAAVHLAVGSPGGLPSASDARAALAGIGVEADPILIVRRAGVVKVIARDARGSELEAKVYGRDAWDGQLLVSLWRFIWYRDGGPTLTLTRLQQVEREAFLTLLAERRGAAVNPVITADKDSIGDALLVTRRVGTPLADLGPGVGPHVGEGLWHALDSLHRAGITHGALDGERVFVDGDSVTLGDLSAAAIDSVPNDFDADRAQALVNNAVVLGIEQAVAQALAVLGPEALADVSSFVQSAALTPRLRRDLAAAGIAVDDIRDRAVEAAGVERRDLQQIRRLTWGRVLMGVLLFYAGSSLVQSLTDIGIDTIIEAMSEAILPLLLLAVFASLLPRVANAFALSGIAPVKVPLGRLTLLQLAMTFVNLAMPSTAGRVAVNIRFFQRSGVEPTTAVAIGALDGFTGFIAQMLLLFTIIGFGLGSLELQIDDKFQIDNVGGLLLALGIILVAAIAVIVFVPSIRERILAVVSQLREFIGPLLRSPRRLLIALSANMSAEVLNGVTQFIVLAAFSQSVGLGDVVLVSIFVGLFAGLMPVPGGIGVTEAALTVGYIAIGVPEEIAFAAALTTRMITFYTPPLYGWFALRWLQRQHYL